MKKSLPVCLVTDFDKEDREGLHDSSDAMIALTRAGINFVTASAEAWQRLTFYSEDGRVFRGLENIQHYIEDIEEYGARKAKKAGQRLGKL